MRKHIQPNRDIDAFATSDRLIAISRSTQFSKETTTPFLHRAYQEHFHENPLANFAVRSAKRTETPMTVPVTIGKFLCRAPLHHAMTRAGIRTSASRIFHESRHASPRITAMFGM